MKRAGIIEHIRLIEINSAKESDRLAIRFLKVALRKHVFKILYFLGNIEELFYVCC